MVVSAEPLGTMEPVEDTPRLRAKFLRSRQGIAQHRAGLKHDGRHAFSISAGIARYPVAACSTRGGCLRTGDPSPRWENAGLRDNAFEMRANVKTRDFGMTPVGAVVEDFRI